MNLSPLLFLCFFVASPLTAAPPWAFETPDQGWRSLERARLYYFNSEMQRLWAWSMIGKLRLQGDEKVVDIGSGDGKICAELSCLLIDGSVLGIELSTAMHRMAERLFPSSAYPNLHFLHTNSLTLEDIDLEPESVDLVTGFCSFHLIQNPEAILERAHQWLTPNGRVALVIPCTSTEHSLFSAATETFAHFGLIAPWQMRAEKTREGTLIRSLEQAENVLHSSGFQVETCALVPTVHTFLTLVDWETWLLGTCSANWGIPDELEREFFAWMARRQVEIDPSMLNEDGSITYCTEIAHVIGRK